VRHTQVWFGVLLDFLRPSLASLVTSQAPWRQPSREATPWAVSSGGMQPTDADAEKTLEGRGRGTLARSTPPGQLGFAVYSVGSHLRPSMDWPLSGPYSRWEVERPLRTTVALALSLR
jgi:hypothetical protein